MSAEIKRTADLTDNDYARAVAIITGDNNASTSYLQRTMQLGYNAAASLIERAEAEGIVSRPNAAGKREVTPAASTIATLTAQLAEARAMAGAVIEWAAELVRFYPQTMLMLPEQERVCEYLAELIPRALDPDAAAALAAHDRALVERWQDALQNVMGHVDTPIGRRRLNINNDQPKWLVEARVLLEGAKP